MTMKHWAVNQSLYKKLEKLRPKGKQESRVIKALILMAQTHHIEWSDDAQKFVVSEGAMTADHVLEVPV